MIFVWLLWWYSVLKSNTLLTHPSTSFLKLWVEGTQSKILPCFIHTNLCPGLFVQSLFIELSLMSLQSLLFLFFLSCFTKPLDNHVKFCSGWNSASAWTSGSKLSFICTFSWRSIDFYADYATSKIWFVFFLKTPEKFCCSCLAPCP